MKLILVVTKICTMHCQKEKLQFVSAGKHIGFLKDRCPLRPSPGFTAVRRSPVVPHHQGELVTVVLRSRPQERKDSGAHMS